MHLQYGQTIRSFGVTVYVKLLGVITESDSILLDISLFLFHRKFSKNIPSLCSLCTVPLLHIQIRISCDIQFMIILWGFFINVFVVMVSTCALWCSLSCFILKVSCSASINPVIKKNTKPLLTSVTSPDWSAAEL